MSRLDRLALFDVPSLPPLAFRTMGRKLLTLEGGDAPDTTKQQEAALMTANLSKEELEWAKQIFEETAPDRAAAQERANRLSDLQFEQMQRSGEMAETELERYNQTFRPIEQSIAAEATNFDTQDRRNQAAGEAIADVTQGFSAARDQGARQMQRMGVNPNDGRMAALQTQTNSAQALAQAQAANAARKQVETQGWARRMDAAGLGKGVVSNQATQASMAAQLGNSALNASNSGLAAGQSGAQIMQNGYRGAISGMNAVANQYGNIASTQAQVNAAESANIGAGIGAAGMVAGAFVI